MDTLFFKIGINGFNKPEYLSLKTFNAKGT